MPKSFFLWRKNISCMCVIGRISSFDRKYRPWSQICAKQREMLQKFCVGLKISWEHGSLVPGEYPTLISSLIIIITIIITIVIIIIIIILLINIIIIIIIIIIISSIVFVLKSYTIFTPSLLKGHHFFLRYIDFNFYSCLDFLRCPHF